MNGLTRSNDTTACEVKREAVEKTDSLSVLHSQLLDQTAKELPNFEKVSLNFRLLFRELSLPERPLAANVSGHR